MGKDGMEKVLINIIKLYSKLKMDMEEEKNIIIMVN